MIQPLFRHLCIQSKILQKAAFPRFNLFTVNTFITCCVRRLSNSSLNNDALKNELQSDSNTSMVLQNTMQFSEEYKKLQKKRKAEYEIGKRHLANMMGEDPETFTQEDVDRAISYLLPSGLCHTLAVPMMKHPDEVFQAEKPLAFDATGRPFHPLYYTGTPNYYSIVKDIADKAEHLQKMMEGMKEKPESDHYAFDGSSWVTKDEFQHIIYERISDDLFDRFIRSMERLMNHPLATKEREFIMRFRREIVFQKESQTSPQIMYTEDNIPYVTTSAKRKKSVATVTVYGRGSGKFTVNGEHNILYFRSIQDRRQIMFPLQLAGVLRSVDVEATVELGGPTGQAGAIKHGIAFGLRSFVEPLVVEKLKLAGLLTVDHRRKERQKPGKRGARARHKYKKR